MSRKGIYNVFSRLAIKHPPKSQRVVQEHTNVADAGGAGPRADGPLHKALTPIAEAVAGIVIRKPLDCAEPMDD